MPYALDDAMTNAPLFAVLRGIRPEEAAPVGDALFEAGFRVLEVTLDSPDAFASLETLAARHSDGAVIAAGTVLTPADVARAHSAGAGLIVAPNFAPDVVAATKEAGLKSAPGVMTPTEAFAALGAGADVLKLFPGDAMTPPVVKGLKAVLPGDVRVVVTGGVTADNLATYLAVGAGVGFGSALYKPGKSAEAVGADAAKMMAAARPALEHWS